MPGSHGGGGGGSHGGGGYHSGGRSSQPTFSTSRPFLGARRYRYLNRYGTYAYFYSSTTPKRVNTKKNILGLIIGIVILLVIDAIFIFSSIPTKLSASKCEETTYIYDNANIIDDEVLLPSLERFYEKTGIQPMVYTMMDDTVYSNSKLEDIAYDKYLYLFPDEGHFMILYQVDEAKTFYHWCDMSGDDTFNVITDKLFDKFQAKLEESLENSFASPTLAFVEAFDYSTDLALSLSTMDLEDATGLLFFNAIFLFVIIATAVSSLKQGKIINEYMDYKETKNNGEDDVSDIDPSEFLNKESSTSDPFEKS